MHRRQLAAVIAPLALVVTLAGCSGGDSSASAAGGEDCTPAHEFDTIKEGTLTVAIPDLPPFATFESADSASGVDVEIIEAIADMECLDVTYSSVSYAAAIPSVQSGRADLAVGDYYRTAVRAETVGLSAPIYLDDMGVISKEGVSTVSEMESMKVGTVDGYLWVEDLRGVLGDKLSIYPSNVEMWADLEAGRIDVGIDSYGVAVNSAEGTEFQVAVAEPDDRVAASVEPAQATFPHTLENEALTTALDEDIATLHEDGTIVAILEEAGLDPSIADTGEPRLIE